MSDDLETRVTRLEKSALAKRALIERCHSEFDSIKREAERTLMEFRNRVSLALAGTSYIVQHKLLASIAIEDSDLDTAETEVSALMEHTGSISGRISVFDHRLHLINEGRREKDTQLAQFVRSLLSKINQSDLGICGAEIARIDPVYSTRNGSFDVALDDKAFDEIMDAVALHEHQIRQLNIDYAALSSARASDQLKARISAYFWVLLLVALATFLALGYLN